MILNETILMLLINLFVVFGCKEKDREILNANQSNTKQSDVEVIKDTNTNISTNSVISTPDPTSNQSSKPIPSPTPKPTPKPTISKENQPKLNSRNEVISSSERVTIKKEEPKSDIVAPVDAKTVQHEYEEAITNNSREDLEIVEVAEPKPAIKYPTKKDENPPITKEVVSFDATNSLLTSYVSSSGKVNYKGIKANKKVLEDAINELQLNAKNIEGTNDEALAFWMNVYNVFTISKIVDNYPISSIKKLNNGKPWDDKFIKLNGKTYTLNEIENNIIRPKFNDPRIHFGINCAAKSCPPLLNRAFTKTNVDAKLNERTISFINDPNQNTISASSANLSKIFDWFGSDFGNVIAYINKYSKTKLQSNASVSFKDYNWDLNE